jgi:hypothetical protein
MTSKRAQAPKFHDETRKKGLVQRRNTVADFRCYLSKEQQNHSFTKNTEAVCTWNAVTDENNSTTEKKSHDGLPSEILERKSATITKIQSSMMQPYPHIFN